MTCSVNAIEQRVQELVENVGKLENAFSQFSKKDKIKEEIRRYYSGDAEEKQTP